MGIVNAGGMVKVGSRVKVGSVWKAATKVGLSVGVVTGVGVGGGSTIGSKASVDKDTLAAYTQPFPRGASANTISIHSLAGERPIAGAVPPTGNEPTTG